MNKRDFIKSAAATTLGLAISDSLLTRIAGASPAQLAADDTFWTALRGKYRLKPDFINLENGYYSMQSEPVLQQFIGRVRELNYNASHYMRTTMAADKVAVARRIAKLAGCGDDELIITRNTTESLDTVVNGYEWKSGDGVVMAEQDYGAMRDMFKLQARRRGIVITEVSIPNHPANDDEIVALYAGAISPATRLLMCCHIVNITGQILPVAKIAAMAKARGVDVMVDGAHAFAQLDYRIPDLGADYYGASLHKWLGAPLGARLLYVRRDKVAGLWPVFADLSMADTDIKKLNHTGTHPCHTDLAINDAIDFHNSIGIGRKEARLRWLQRYWTDKVRGLPNIIINTPADATRACAIANVDISSILPGELAKQLLERYKIWTVAINSAGVRGVRITPQLFTTTKELDTLVNALKRIANTA